MSKQTAVNWLISQMPFEYTSSRAAFEAIQIAKQMEREQIEDAYNKVHYDKHGNEFTSEEYYRDTYLTSGGNNGK